MARQCRTKRHRHGAYSLFDADKEFFMEMTWKPDAQSLRARRYIAYARCATQRGSAAKLREQIRLIRQFADRLHMRFVDEVRIAGVSGFSPTLRSDLRRLMARKQKRDDFDLLIMADHARLTRTDGAGRIEALLALNGVRIVYLTDVGLGTEMAQRCITGCHKGSAYSPAALVAPLPPATGRKATVRTHKTARP